MGRAIRTWRDPLRYFTYYELDDGTIVPISDQERCEGSVDVLVAILESTKPRDADAPKPYAVRVWCRDCFGIDPEGCFDGGDEVREFASADERDRYVTAIRQDGVPWSVELINSEGDGR